MLLSFLKRTNISFIKLNQKVYLRKQSIVIAYPGSAFAKEIFEIIELALNFKSGYNIIIEILY